jgi:hypothetical protein
MSKLLPLLVVLLLALLTAPSLYADEAEDKAVAAVEQLGGRVWRDDKDPAHPVVHLEFSYKDVTDADLRKLTVFKGLKALSLCGTGLTDAGMRELQRCGVRGQGRMGGPFRAG